MSLEVLMSAALHCWGQYIISDCQWSSDQDLKERVIPTRTWHSYTVRVVLQLHYLCSLCKTTRRCPTTTSDCSCAFPVSTLLLLCVYVCVCVLHHAELYLYVVGRFSWSFVWWRGVVSPRGREAERSSSPAFLLPLFTKPRPLPGNSLSKPAACSHNFLHLLRCVVCHESMRFHFGWFISCGFLSDRFAESKESVFAGLVKIHTQHVSTPHMFQIAF